MPQVSKMKCNTGETVRREESRYSIQLTFQNLARGPMEAIESRPLAVRTEGIGPRDEMQQQQRMRDFVCFL